MAGWTPFQIFELYVFILFPFLVALPVASWALYLVLLSSRRAPKALLILSVGLTVVLIGAQTLRAWEFSNEQREQSQILAAEYSAFGREWPPGTPVRVNRFGWFLQMPGSGQHEEYFQGPTPTP